MQPVEAEAEHHEIRKFQRPGQPQASGSGRTPPSSARRRSSACVRPGCAAATAEQGIEHRTDAETGKHDAGNRRARLAGVLQGSPAMCGKMPNTTSDSTNTAPKQILASGLSKDGAVIRTDGRQVEARRLLLRRIAKADQGRDHHHHAEPARPPRTPRASRRDRRRCRRPRRPADCRSWWRPAAARSRPAAAPPECGRRRSQARSERCRPDAIPATTREANSTVKFGRDRAHERRQHQQHQTDAHQPRLAHHVGERAERRLDQRIGQGERGRKQRRGPDLHGESVRDQRHHRIDRAREQRRHEHDQPMTKSSRFIREGRRKGNGGVAAAGCQGPRPDVPNLGSRAAQTARYFR